MTLTDQLIKTNTPFAFFIEKTDFKDPNEDPLACSSTLANGSPLPEWLTFNPSIPALIGTPKQSDVGNLKVLIYVKDALHKEVFSPLNIVVSHDNRPPQVASKIAAPLAKVGEAYNLIPTNAFTDPDGDKLRYSTSLDDGGTLPNWLVFSQDGDAPSFKGTPTPADTNFFQAKRLDITLKAEDGKGGAAFTTFPILVGGESYPEKIIKVAGPVISALTFAFAAYEKRALFLNVINEKKYRKPLQKASVGKPFSYHFECDKEKIRKVVVYALAKNGLKERICSRLCCKKEVQNWSLVPNDIPSWLKFNCNIGKMHSQPTGPEESDMNLVRVQALGSAGVILEQFDIEVLPRQWRTLLANAQNNDGFLTGEESKSDGYAVDDAAGTISIPMTPMA